MLLSSTAVSLNLTLPFNADDSGFDRSYSRIATFIDMIALQQFVLTVWQPLYFITGEIIKLSGPYGKTLYYPSGWSFIAQLILILVLFTPFFCLFFALKQINWIMFANWYTRFGEEVKEENAIQESLSKTTIQELKLK